MQSILTSKLLFFIYIFFFTFGLIVIYIMTLSKQMTKKKNLTNKIEHLYIFNLSIFFFLVSLRTISIYILHFLVSQFFNDLICHSNDKSPDALAYLSADPNVHRPCSTVTRQKIVCTRHHCIQTHNLSISINLNPSCQKRFQPNSRDPITSTLEEQ